jgi:hypothetical protein
MYIKLVLIAHEFDYFMDCVDLFLDAVRYKMAMVCA